ncbi:MAG: MFS transporter [Rhodobacteraceae bacterium]|nr:MFS transporter [Paracoccaceae bacterium]
MSTTPISTPAPNAGGHREAAYLDADHPISPGEIAIGVILGRTSEFFDYFVFAIAAVLVFPALVFPFADPLVGTLYSFAIFALAFIARPVGSAIFMEIDRRHGREVKLTIALVLLGSATVVMGFLPGYDQVGLLSVLILSVARVAQGLALGGVWDGLASLLSLNAPENRRGWYAMIPQLGAPLGLIVASLLFAYFRATLSQSDFFEWGWRYPFFVAFAINVVALFARLRMVSTPQFERLFASRDLQPSPLVPTLREEGRNIVIGAFIPLASFAMFHMVTVFPLSWVVLQTDSSPTRFLVFESIGAALGVLAIVASGVLADLYGRRALLSVSAGAIAAFSGFAPQLLGGGTLGEISYVVIGFLILGISFGQSSGAVASNFDGHRRYTSSALTSDIAWLLGAGFAPFVALVLASSFGIAAAGGYLLSGAVVTLVALAANRTLASRT